MTGEGSTRSKQSSFASFHFAAMRLSSRSPHFSFSSRKFHCPLDISIPNLGIDTALPFRTAIRFRLTFFRRCSPKLLSKLSKLSFGTRAKKRKRRRVNSERYSEVVGEDR